MYKLLTLKSGTTVRLEMISLITIIIIGISKYSYRSMVKKNIHVSELRQTRLSLEKDIIMTASSMQG